jgi:hypothetical protein
LPSKVKLIFISKNSPLKFKVKLSEPGPIYTGLRSFFSNFLLTFYQLDHDHDDHDHDDDDNDEDDDSDNDHNTTINLHYHHNQSALSPIPHLPSVIMTPLPTPSELATRHIFDPAPGTVHVRDLIAMAKDGIYAKDRVSDYVVGMLVMAKHTGVISAWEGTLFQLPFVKGMKIRTGMQHLGCAFTDPDGDVLILDGRTLHGSSDIDIKLSTLTVDSLKDHAQYSTWLKTTLYAGRAADATTYTRVRNNHTLKACDAYVNSVPYTPGPMSIAPAASHPFGSDGTATSAKKKKKTPAGKKTAPEPASKEPDTAKNPPVKLFVMNKATAKAFKAAALRNTKSSDEEKGTTDAESPERESTALSDPPSTEDEGSTHPQYGGKLPTSFSELMASEGAPEEFDVEEPAAEKLDLEELAADMYAVNEPVAEKPAPEEFCVDEPLPAADDQDSGDDYDPTPTKKRKTGKSGGKRGKKGKGRGGKK